MAIVDLSRQKCRVGNLTVEAYDAESLVNTRFTNIITSTYTVVSEGAFTVAKIQEVGTVFRIRAYGYAKYIEEGFEAAKEAQCEGASRLVFYPTSQKSGYPRYVSAFFGWDTSEGNYRPLFWGEGYLSRGTYPSWNSSNLLNGGLATRPDYFYATLIVGKRTDANGDFAGNTLMLRVATEPTFKYVDRLWPASMQLDLDFYDGDPFIMPQLTLIPFYSGENNFLNGLSLGLCGTGVPSITASADFSKGYVAGSELRRNRN